MDKLKTFLRKAKASLNAAVIKRASRTFLYAFLATTVAGYLGWLNGLTSWASSEGQTPMPEWDNLWYITVAGITAGVIALFNGAGLWLENMTGKAPLRDVTPVVK